jgi:hypothetical protein
LTEIDKRRQKYRKSETKRRQGRKVKRERLEGGDKEK